MMIHRRPLPSVTAKTVRTAKQSLLATSDMIWRCIRRFAWKTVENEPTHAVKMSAERRNRGTIADIRSIGQQMDDGTRQRRGADTERRLQKQRLTEIERILVPFLRHLTDDNGVYPEIGDDNEEAYVGEDKTVDTKKFDTQMARDKNVDCNRQYAYKNSSRDNPTRVSIDLLDSTHCVRLSGSVVERQRLV